MLMQKGTTMNEVLYQTLLNGFLTQYTHISLQNFFWMKKNVVNYKLMKNELENILKEGNAKPQQKSTYFQLKVKLVLYFDTLCTF